MKGSGCPGSRPAALPVSPSGITARPIRPESGLSEDLERASSSGVLETRRPRRKDARPAEGILFIGGIIPCEESKEPRTSSLRIHAGPHYDSVAAKSERRPGGGREVSSSRRRAGSSVTHGFQQRLHSRHAAIPFSVRSWLRVARNRSLTLPFFNALEVSRSMKILPRKSLNIADSEYHRLHL